MRPGGLGVGVHLGGEALAGGRGEGDDVVVVVEHGVDGAGHSRTGVTRGVLGATGGRRGFLIAHPVAWQGVRTRSGPSAAARIILLDFLARIGDDVFGGEFSVGGVTDRALARSACGRGPDQDDG